MNFENTSTRYQVEHFVTRFGPLLWHNYEPGSSSAAKSLQGDRVLTPYELYVLQMDVKKLLNDYKSGWPDVILGDHSDRALDALEKDAMSEFLECVQFVNKSDFDSKLLDQGVAITLRSHIKRLLASIPIRKELNFIRLEGPLREPLIDSFLSRRVLDPLGEFVSRSSNPSAWRTARKNGVTATDANRLIRLSGEKRTSWAQVLASKADDYTEPHFQAYDLGLEREPIIVNWAVDNFPEEEFSGNDFLFHGEESYHLATPDLVGKYAIGEIKVSTKPLNACLTRYRDQLQWQLHVMMSEQVLFVVENRVTQERELTWVDRDESRIEILVEAADLFHEELQYGSRE